MKSAQKIILQFCFSLFVVVAFFLISPDRAKAALYYGSVSIEGGTSVNGKLTFDNKDEQIITANISADGNMDIYIALVKTDKKYYSLNLMSELVETGRDFIPFYQSYDFVTSQTTQIKIKVPLKGLTDGEYSWVVGICGPGENIVQSNRNINLSGPTFIIESNPPLGITLSTDKTSYNNKEEQILKIDITGEVRVDAYLYVTIPSGAKYYLKSDMKFGEANQITPIKSNWITEPGSHSLKLNLQSLPEGKYIWNGSFCFPGDQLSSSNIKDVSAEFGIVSDTDVKDDYYMVYIEGGSFMMGSHESQYRNYDEIPQHFVKVSSFYISKYEVTNAQYLAYKMSLSKGEGEYFANVIKGKENYPVSEVSWNDAVKYCQWLSQLTGQTYRLPTEAEWEYACRAGTTTEYYWGDEIVPAAQPGNYRAGPTPTVPGPVGLYVPNQWGLYDMVGNVNEWCSDWYSETYYQTSPEDNPKGPDTGEYKVYRGGDYLDTVLYIRSAIRNHLVSPTSKSPQIGFRLVREINQ